MKSIVRGAIFFGGWLLSPFTWWNDAFVNIPLSYLVASGLHAFWSGVPFGWIMLGCYWFTNILGLAMMCAEGKRMARPGGNWKRTLVWMGVFMIIYSALMFYLDRTGRLPPLGRLVGRPGGVSAQGASE